MNSTTPDIIEPGKKVTVHTRGHVYELPNRESGTQKLVFVCRSPNEILSPNHPTASLTTAVDGVEADSVIIALIEHLAVCHERLPSNYTLFAIYDLERALFNLQARREDRVARGVEGKPLP